MAWRLELAAADDPYYDYCLWQYAPAAPPEGKLRSANLLYSSFAVAGMPDRAGELVQAIRGAVGAFNTVWGIKWLEGQLRWELYFYDYRRRARERSATRTLAALRPFVPCAVVPNERLDYFMFSLDLSCELLAGAATLDQIHLYIGNPGSAVSSGMCYSVSRQRTRLENFYFFFDARQLDQIAGKISSSAFFDASSADLEQLLWPQMRGCRVIVVANKQHNDAIYFSRISIDQLLYFLRRMEYPASHLAFVEANRPRLDHLLYDVGIDYRMEGGRLCLLKSGYYGIF